MCLAPGVFSPFLPCSKWQNNVAVLDTERWHWRHPTIDGSNPAPRSYHSATVVGNLMVVFGGNNQHESFDKVHVLDTSAYQTIIFYFQLDATCYQFSLFWFFGGRGVLRFGSGTCAFTCLCVVGMLGRDERFIWRCCLDVNTYTINNKLEFFYTLESRHQRTTHSPRRRLPQILFSFYYIRQATVGMDMPRSSRCRSRSPHGPLGHTAPRRTHDPRARRLGP